MFSELDDRRVMGVIPFSTVAFSFEYSWKWIF